MYIIGSETADDEIPKIIEELNKFIESRGGLVEKYENLGKKKLAYQIKKSRIGNYVLVNFSAPADKIQEIEHRVLTTLSIIRYLVVNMDDALLRLEKDKLAQAKLKLLRPKEEIKERVAARGPEKQIEIDLDREIEKALESPEELK